MRVLRKLLLSLPSACLCSCTSIGGSVFRKNQPMRRIRVNGLLLLLVIFGVLPYAFAQETPHDTDMGIPNASNTDHECVLLSRKVLGQGETEAAQNVPRLIECLKGDYFYFEKGAAKIALVRIGRPAVPALIEALDNADSYISEGAAITLGMIGPKAKEAVPPLINILLRTKTSIALQMQAAKALGKIGEIDLLIRILQGQEPGIRANWGAQGLAAAGPAAASAVPALMEALKSSDSILQMYAAEALGEIGPAANPAVQQLAELSKSSLNFLRHAAGDALLKIGTPEARAAGRPYELRKNLVDAFFKIMSVFVWNPLLALVTGMVLGGLAFLGTRARPERKGWSRTLFAPSAAWVLYAVWEYYMKKGGANIRIDLLVIYPVLAVGTFLGLTVWLTGLVLPRRGHPT